MSLYEQRLGNVPQIYRTVLKIELEQEAKDNGTEIPKLSFDETFEKYITKSTFLDNIEPTVQHFCFLEMLRRTGVTNMFGSGPWLEKAFELERRQGSKIVSNWMKHYDPDDYKGADFSGALDKLSMFVDDRDDRD